jgi:hypothetical protein
VSPAAPLPVTPLVPAVPLLTAAPPEPVEPAVPAPGRPFEALDAHPPPSDGRASDKQSGNHAAELGSVASQGNKERRLMVLL